MEFFESPVIPEPPLMASSTNINKLCVGRTKASQYFFRKPETRKNRKLWDSLRNISDHFRMYQSQALTVDVMREEVMEAERRLNEMEMNLEDLVSKAGVTYTMMLNPGVSSDKLFKGSDSESVEFRKEMSMNCRIIKYIYCTDNILDSDDKDVLSCTKDCLALDDRDLGNNSQSTNKDSQSRASSSRQTPNKMDSEKQPY